MFITYIKYTLNVLNFYKGCTFHPPIHCFILLQKMIFSNSSQLYHWVFLHLYNSLFPHKSAELTLLKSNSDDFTFFFSADVISHSCLLCDWFLACYFACNSEVFVRNYLDSCSLICYQSTCNSVEKLLSLSFLFLYSIYGTNFQVQDRCLFILTIWAIIVKDQTWTETSKYSIFISA